MGTHSFIIMRVKQVDGSYKEWFRLYQQYDGYPDYVGARLCEWLKNVTMVSGIPMSGDGQKHYANGPACLFAQLVVLFKETLPAQRDQGGTQSMLGRPGGAYLYPPSEAYDEEWNYYVDVDSESKNITFQAFQRSEKILFCGTPAEGEHWCRFSSDDNE